MTQQVAVEGRHDFDVIFGEWRILNCKLEDPLADSSEWMEFDATVDVRPILGGLGNVDLYSAPDFPGRPGYEGFGLRLFDPETGLWRIWWASTVGRGMLDTPVVGRFRDGEGRFECDARSADATSRCASTGRTSPRRRRAGSSLSRSTAASASSRTGSWS